MALAALFSSVFYRLNIYMDIVKEYMILRGPASKLTADVNRAIIDGWQPFGSPTVSDHDASEYALIFQVMVKYETG